MSGLDIIFQDEHIVVVNKPSGLLSVPGRGPDKQDCVVHRLKALIPHCMEQPSVHRLDMDTSGLQLLALQPEGQRQLCIQFQEQKVRKLYYAVVDGIVNDESGTIELAFRLDPDHRPYQVYDPVQGKMGITRWRKLGVEDEQTLVEFEPQTGRTHQLRVHAAHELGLGFPIVGDRLYGTGTAPGQLKLHSGVLEFRHPGSGEALVFKNRPPWFPL